MSALLSTPWPLWFWLAFIVGAGVSLAYLAVLLFRAWCGWMLGVAEIDFGGGPDGDELIDPRRI
jgi:hypothetical protein